MMNGELVDPGYEDHDYADDDAPSEAPPDARTRTHEESTRDAPYIIETAEEIAAPLPPLEWLCRGLRLARSSITIVGGFGYSRKTLYAQSLALSIAAGKPALGVFEVDHGPALHIDYEQGKRITRERYQRLARAADINLSASLLSVVTFPRFKLTSLAARDTLRRLLEETKARFVVLDSLRAAMEGVEENSSEVRESIDLVGQELKRVDAAGIIIHHARKPTEGNRPGGRYSLRGSGAIFDACDSVFIFAGEKGQPTTVEHEKDRLVGTELAPFGLDSEDVDRDGDPRWGLRLVHQEAEQIAAAAEAKRDDGLKVVRSKTCDAIRSYLTRHGGAFSGSRSQLRDATNINRSEFFGALTEMVTDGALRLEGGKRDLRIVLGT